MLGDFDAGSFFASAPVLGAGGAILAELVVVTPYRIKRRDKRPWWLRELPDWLFWAVGVGWIMFGAWLTWLMLKDATGYNPIIGLQIGGTAPLFAERLLASLPEGDPGSVG